MISQSISDYYSSNTGYKLALSKGYPESTTSKWKCLHFGFSYLEREERREKREERREKREERREKREERREKREERERI